MNKQKAGEERERAKVTAALLFFWRYRSEPHTQVISFSHSVFVK